MEVLAAIPKYGFWFLLLLTILVFVHEMGHYLVARLCGVRVEEVADPLLRKIRQLDKLVDELARGKKMASILRR